MRLRHLAAARPEPHALRPRLLRLRPLAPRLHALAARLLRLRPLAPRLHAPLILAPLVFAGCGTTRTTTFAHHRLALTLQEYRILPRHISVPAGALHITACNRGILTHNLALQRGTLDSSERTTLTGIPTLLPGHCGAVTTQPLAAGGYLLTSTVGNQAVLGMAATLIVR